MKRYISFLFIILFACQLGEQSKSTNIITVSIIPQKYFIERIAGELVDVNVLIPSGANPATYSLLPSQMKDIAHSKAWFRMDYIGFELSWAEKIMNVNSDMKVFSLSKGIKLIHSEESNEEHYHKGGIDPHFWVSPREVSIIAENTLKALVKLYPEHQELFQENYKKLASDIETVDARFFEMISHTKVQSFLIFHPALSYLARQYGLEQIAIEDMGKEPSPQHVKEVIQIAHEKNIKYIFIQKEFNKDNAQTIAKEIGGKVIQINPLDYNWVEQMEETTKKMQIVLN